MSESAAKPKKNLLDAIKEIARKERSWYFFILTLMFLFPVCELVTELLGAPFVTQPLILSVYGGAGIFFSLIGFADRVHEKLFYPSDVFFVLLILFATISLIFTKDILASSTGYAYDELPLHFMAYYSLMYAGTRIESERLRRNILLGFCAVGVIQGVVAFFQTFGLRIADSYNDPVWHRTDNLAFGLIQHNNWFAGLCALLVGAAVGMSLFTERKKARPLFFALSALMIYVSLCTSARIAWVGNAVIVIFYAISLAIMSRRTMDRARFHSAVKSFLVILGLYAAIIALLALCTSYLVGGVEEFARESGGGDGFDGFANGRGYIWRFGLEALPGNWLTGVGLDNYRYVFMSNPRWSEGMNAWGKAHSEYIHMLVTQGVFAFLNYFTFLIYTAVTGIRSVLSAEDESRRATTWCFLGMFAAYAAQAFFNSSLINVAPYFWITAGMILSHTAQKPLGLRKSARSAQSGGNAS